MDLPTLFGAILLGIVEGATEFVPVSSTGHLILLVDLLGFQGPPGRVFEVVIQLGAILAVCWLYRAKLIGTLIGLPTDPGARRFTLAVLLAFVPAAVVGALLHGFIKSVLFSPTVVSVALIVGGIAILAVERLALRPRVFEVDAIGPRRALAVGCCQMLALVPGVSRSGATILGGLICGLDRRTATEFSFFLAIPTMFGATAYDLYKNRDVLTVDGALVIAIGFGAAFLTALLVVRAVVGFVGRHGFAAFAWYRIALGSGILVLIGLDIG
jgi:undecaprenyl-diphosphatase